MNILITRPRSQALHTAAQLEKRGQCVFVLSLTKIVPLDFILPQQSFEALLASSANAFSSNPQEFSSLYSMPLFCVGEQTALAAQRAGFSTIAAIATQASTLISCLKNYPACHLLYLAGKNRRPILEKKLNMQGKIVTTVEIYQQQPLRPTPSVMAKLPPRFDYALFYSAMAAQEAVSLTNFFDTGTQFLCLSKRIARALPQNFQHQACIATTPSEASLLELIN